jgi:dTDP-4-amino-4,6-dideoxygalactose transaminase
MMRYIGKEELDALEKVIESQQLWRGKNGNFVVKFEEAIGKHFGRKCVSAVNLGTSANKAAVVGHPEKTSLTAYEVYELRLKGEGIGLSYFNDTVDHLEPVFQKCEKERKTPFGYPLPKHVKYEPGLCPKAEEAAKRTIMFGVHHGEEMEEIRSGAKALKNTMMRHVKYSIQF